MTFTNAEKSIIKVVSHFDVLDYPLTAQEIHKYSDQSLTISEVLRCLKSASLIKLIESQQGLYFIAGREAIVGLRLERYRLALPKLKRAQYYATILSNFPWVKAIAIYSSLALKNSSVNSDIDLFFITAKNRAWSARLFINTFLKFFRLRPTPTISKNRLCASYLIAEDQLDLSTANFESDYFYTYGCAGFIFLTGSQNIIDEFWKSNYWIDAGLPNWQPASRAQIYQPKNSSFKLQRILEIIFNQLSESSLKNWQLKIMPNKYHANCDGKKVILADGCIKLHDNDKRQKYNELFLANYHCLINYEQ